MNQANSHPVPGHGDGHRRLFLDTRHLIDIGERKPSACHLLDRLTLLLAKGGVEVVLSSFLIEELTNTPASYRAQTVAGIKRLAELRHSWLVQPPDLERMELNSFVAGSLGLPRAQPRPFVPSWVDAHRSTLPGPIYEKYKAAPLEELLEGYAERRSEFAPTPILRALRQQAIESSRDVTMITGDGVAWKAGMIRERLVRHVPQRMPSRILVPGSKFTEWARMLAAWTGLCEIPATRTFLDTYLVYLKDRCGRQQTGDFFDLSHLYALPYVDAFTCDKTTFEYVKQLKRRLCALGIARLESVQVFKSLDDVVGWLSGTG